MKKAWLFAFALAAQQAGAAAPDVDTACLDCHRAHQDRGEVPAIAGQHREYLVHQLQRFRERHRESFPMTAFARGMDDATIDALATARAARPWTGVPSVASDDAARRGREVATRRGCDTCHGAGFDGAGDIPRLAGQHAGYLARQIEGFGKGDRYHPPTGTGSPMRSVPPDQARDLADFVHTLGRPQLAAPAEDDD
jgi:cytochrome c553